jgi:hypothetical protein
MASRPAADPLARLRVWWLRRQGLVPATAPKAIDAWVRQAGWIPTSGSTAVYLSMRVRMPGVSRDAIDRTAIDGVSLIEVPGAHGRPSMLVPPGAMALALRLHAATFDKHAAPLLASGRISEAALLGVSAQVCRALDEGPLQTVDIRKAITHPDAGELLVGALSSLSVRGISRRFPQDGRLDSAKYMYESRHPEDRPDLDAKGDLAAVATQGTGLFQRRHGPATTDELAWWLDAAKGAVRQALRTLGAEPVAIPGWSDHAWLLADDLPEWRAFKGDGDRIVLLPYRDPFVYVRRGPAVLTRNADTPVLANAYGALKRARITDVDGLDHHTILSGGEVVGVWEYDPDARDVVTRVWS